MSKSSGSGISLAGIRSGGDSAPAAEQISAAALGRLIVLAFEAEDVASCLPPELAERAMSLGAGLYDLAAEIIGVGEDKLRRAHDRVAFKRHDAGPGSEATDPGISDVRSRPLPEEPGLDRCLGCGQIAQVLHMRAPGYCEACSKSDADGYPTHCACGRELAHEESRRAGACSTCRGVIVRATAAREPEPAGCLCGHLATHHMLYAGGDRGLCCARGCACRRFEVRS